MKSAVRVVLLWCYVIFPSSLAPVLKHTPTCQSYTISPNPGPLWSTIQTLNSNASTSFEWQSLILTHNSRPQLTLQRTPDTNAFSVPKLFLSWAAVAVAIAVAIAATFCCWCWGGMGGVWAFSEGGLGSKQRWGSTWTSRILLQSAVRHGADKQQDKSALSGPGSQRREYATPSPHANWAQNVLKALASRPDSGSDAEHAKLTQYEKSLCGVGER